MLLGRYVFLTTNVTSLLISHVRFVKGRTGIDAYEEDGRSGRIM